ncbi:DUF624 domain-containing protein [Microbacterium sp. NPDC019599]|uniref:DUF624 domain-containing protein n=1 Tax=Microbacterium sp. NPDC019599 TaxID=3154690 RepID=UPI003406BC9F
MTDIRERPRPASSADLADVPGWAGVVMAVLRVVTQLVGINLLMIAGTLAGGVVAGLAPAASAARALTARLATTDPSTSLWRDFWSHWRARFVRANLLALPFWGAGMLVAADVWMLGAAQGAVRAAMGAALLVVVLYLAVALAYLPIVAGEHADPWAPSVRFVLLAPALFPARGFAILAVLAAVGLVYWFVPPIALLFGAALPLLLTGMLSAPAVAASAR